MNVRRFTYYSLGKPIVQGSFSPRTGNGAPAVAGEKQQEREEIGELVGVVS
jgi:hypothetical protein